MYWSNAVSTAVQSFFGQENICSPLVADLKDLEELKPSMVAVWKKHCDIRGQSWVKLYQRIQREF